MNSDMEELLRAVSYSSTAAPAIDALITVTRQQQGDVGNLAVEVNRLTDAARATAATNVAPPKSTQVAAGKNDNDTVETVVKTVGMLTGVGPIITGLFKLFGSSDPEPLPALEKFQMPGSVSVEAGLSATREYGGIRYSAGGRPEVVGQTPSSITQAPAIQVNIQAMDSQSFLDRQDDIARAVREAMLHSNPLNDVVQEL